MKKNLYEKTERIQFRESELIKKRWIHFRKIRGFGSLSDYIRFTINQDIELYSKNRVKI